MYVHMPFTSMRLIITDPAVQWCILCPTVIASAFNRPDVVKLGRCDLIEEIITSEDKVCIF